MPDKAAGKLDEEEDEESELLVSLILVTNLNTLLT